MLYLYHGKQRIHYFQEGRVMRGKGNRFLFGLLVFLLLELILLAALLRGGTAYVAESSVYEQAQEVVSAGEWVVKGIYLPRVLGHFGRVELVFENARGERKLLKFAQEGDAATLVVGDRVTFSLVTVVEDKRGRKVPSGVRLHKNDVGSYLVLHRKR